MSFLTRLVQSRFVRRLGTVAGYTLLSRVTGAVRDLAFAAVIGAGPMADAFFIALRLPNHFRAIFAEGAFNAAFVPTYNETLTREGPKEASAFAGRALSAMIVLQVVLLVLAEIYTDEFLRLTVPGFSRDAHVAALAVGLTRVTFPFLASVTVITVLGAVLNAHGRFAAAAGAPILFNVAVILALPFANLLSAPPYAPAIGVLVSGVAQIILVQVALRRAGLAFPLLMPRLDREVSTFLKRVGPAIIGSGAAQIAAFADTFLVGGLPYGAASALNYADRLYQLPIGVIGVAMGTVLLPELSKLFASGNIEGARAAQRRAIRWSLILTLPFAALFLVFPSEIVSIVYQRGAFHAADVPRAAATLQAYSIGLIAVVLIRSVVAGFNARGDTRTPMLVAIVVLVFNVTLKVMLTGSIDVAGLAAATSAGAWANFIALVVIDHRRRRLERTTQPTPDR
ncbi:MAG: murein biosynthesis integral membrane protein MurJ [Ancalomicrobiaceae bacterium]|nr:murein biosynthesis integral membrane protein MurJ [Ancalomicrobiaceae bacterium]